MELLSRVCHRLLRNASSSNITAIKRSGDRNVLRCSRLNISCKSIQPPAAALSSTASVPTTSKPRFLASRAPCRSSIKTSVPGCSNARGDCLCLADVQIGEHGATDVLGFTTFSQEGGVAIQILTAAGAFPCESSTASGVEAPNEFVPRNIP
jgi:hypothetical protein